VDEIVVPLTIVVNVSVAITLGRVLDTVLKDLLTAPGSGVDFLLVLRGRLGRNQHLFNCLKVSFLVQFGMSDKRSCANPG
jgi:hypothetical protein